MVTESAAAVLIVSVGQHPDKRQGLLAHLFELAEREGESCDPVR